ncbi:MAG TPA: amylo-alpha-1,6-glucosidase [Terriglobia bacterium]|nr:amylo-alpha-1,6-glucosidase [Terriglobia bacterium]
MCANLATSEAREWLITNGIGGFAAGTMAGLLTRRYHGLLVAALKPPLGRTLLVTKIDEVAEYEGKTFVLGANRWAGGAVDPRGYEFIERFHLEGTTPVWTYALDGALLEKRVWMEQGANTTYVSYRLVRSPGALHLASKVLINYRDFHSCTHAGDWRMDVQPVDHGLRVIAFPGATPFYLLSSQATAESVHDWYRNYDLAVERYRGLEACEDHLHAATFGATLAPGDGVTLVLSTESAPHVDSSSAFGRRLQHERSLLVRWDSAQPSLKKSTPPWALQLVLAADQFIVARPNAQNPRARTVIAGYPWFGDWGRDTMIALPGLTLITGRSEISKDILRTFARFVDRGMMPNTFPEGGEPPHFNTVDAALWYFEAARQYFAATRDSAMLRELFPILAEIISQYTKGTRFNIHADPADGLLYAGESGVALTWMDAKVGDWVVTPRVGKPVDVNALWFGALLTMARLARSQKKNSSEYESMALRAREGFRRFWNATSQCCFDVLDGPEGNDARFRPNQILAVSLSERLLSAEQRRAVVDACERELLTPSGLRSLSPRDPQYRGHYGGPPHERDAAYHQGTVWGWLLGPFVLAHLQVYQDRARAAAFLEPAAQAILEFGLGTVGEIFDGDAPFAPRGCIAQAWTVGELLRAWVACQGHSATRPVPPKVS